MQEQSLAELVENYDVQAAGLQSLRAHRIRHILLVASLYDSYTLSEGEHLSELVMGEFRSLSLSAPPQISRVSTCEQALDLLGRRRVDLVITMAQVGDMPAADFGNAAKALHPGLPVYLMAYNMTELLQQPGGPTAIPGIDGTFIWRGDVSLFLALIKLSEDRLDAEHDTQVAEVRTLILVEDSVPFYSSYLPMIFSELVHQTESLISEQVNLAQRRLRRRLRPKVLLACSYEHALELYERYESTVLCVISDVEFPRGGVLDPEAGIALLSRIRERDRDVPLILQSSQKRFTDEADRLGAGFLHKRSRTLLADFHAFMLENLGFGDFVFLMSDGTEVARAGDVGEMLEVLESVPAEALRFHGTRHHFSNWLMARTEFGLATALRKLQVSDFETIEDMRVFLCQTLTSVREGKSRGQVADFDADRPETVTGFVRIGGGSLGGKGRGLAFMYDLLSRAHLDRRLDSVRVAVPNSAVIGTDVFDAFLEANDLRAFALNEEDDLLILRRFLAADLPEKVTRDLSAYLEHVRYPLAVRSSSLLEDSRNLPAAGIYPTHMIPNSDEELLLRLADLECAIKHIYASTFFEAAKAYLASTPSRVEDEKMAIVIQQIVGRRHGSLAYPDISGVARSLNLYPIRDMKPEEGIAFVALGLGRTVVEGGKAVRFSPAYPQWMPQFSSPKDTAENAQRQFWALDLERPLTCSDLVADSNLVQLDLAAAKGHGTLWPVASVFSPENDAVYDGMARQGIPLVTMAPILKYDVFPLAKAIRLLLELGAIGMSGPVEIEFAATVQPAEGEPQEFALLQIRPLVQFAAVGSEALDDVVAEDVFVRSSQALGLGQRAEIRDIVAVRPDVFDRSRTTEIAAEIGRLNAGLQADGRPYLLIGPGRWGTADHWMGVPVKWFQIAGARAIIEVGLKDLDVEPSQGTHFFHNMTSLGIAYLTIDARQGDAVDWDWLADLPLREETRWVRHYELEEPVEVLIDAQAGEGVVLKCARKPAGLEEEGPVPGAG